MYIENLVIRNFRNFDCAKLHFKDGVNTIIGENGSGKTNLFFAMRLLLDGSLPRNIKLFESDFNRTLDNWRGHWIIISLTFDKLDSSEETQCLATHATGHSSIAEKGTYTLYFRPNMEKRRLLSEWSKDTQKDARSLEKLRAEIGFEDYELVYRGRSTADFTDEDIYKELVGDFEGMTFPDPDNEDAFKYGVQLPRQMNFEREVSCTFIKALRDVQSELRSYSNSPLINLLRGEEKSIDVAKSEEIIRGVKSLNDTIGSLEEVQRLEAGVDDSIKTAVGKTYAPNIELRSELPDDMERLFQSLKLWVGDPGEEGYKGKLWELSLGGANLIYLSLKLLEYERLRNDRAANFLLIEEPEAHIHTHIQKTLFDNIEKDKTQVFVSTHSTHISSVSKIQSVSVLARDTKRTKVFNPSNGMSSNEVSRIERYLDAVRSTLLFAKGVIMVEGDAEQILIPAFFQKLFGISLDEIGISVVNIGSTGFRNVASVFGPKRIGRNCSIVTDLDASMEELPEDPENDSEAQKKQRNSEKKGNERRIILNEFSEGNEFIEVFYSPNTFEVSLAGENKDEFIKCTSDVYSQRDKIQEVSQNLKSEVVLEYGSAALEMANYQGKGWFALTLAEHLTFDSILPQYILDAISHACGGLNNDILADIALYRLENYSLAAESDEGIKALALLDELSADSSEIVAKYLEEFPDDILAKWVAS